MLYQRASALAPENHELRFWAGLGAAQAGDLDAGVTHVLAAIEMHPNWRELLGRLPPRSRRRRPRSWGACASRGEHAGRWAAPRRPRTLRFRADASQISPVRGFRDLRDSSRCRSACTRARRGSRRSSSSATCSCPQAERVLQARRGRVLPGPAGRAGGRPDHRQIDSAFNEFHQSRWGMFGFLEFEDDPEVLDALLAPPPRGCASGAASGWSGRWTSRSTTRAAC